MAQISSLGMDFRGILRISGRFWRVEGPHEGSVKVGGDGGVWRSREDVGGGGYGAKLGRGRDGEAGENRRVVGSRYLGPVEEVVGEERAGSGGWNERVGGECREGDLGVASGVVERRSGAVEKSGREEGPERCTSIGGGVVTASGEEWPGGSHSTLGGAVVRAVAGKSAGGSGQPSPGGRRPESPIYDSLETCPRLRSFGGG